MQITWSIWYCKEGPVVGTGDEAGQAAGQPHRPETHCKEFTFYIRSHGSIWAGRGRGPPAF